MAKLNPPKPCASLQTEQEPLFDRISELPDCVLSHILSFLPTKNAVGTSILSNRWKFLWTSITNLDFDFTSYLTPHDPTNTKWYEDDFTRFVNRVFEHLNQPSITKFRLNCNHSCECDDVYSWISTAVSRRTQELDLCVNKDEDPRGEEHFLPSVALTSTMLVVLKLQGDFCLDLESQSVTLPALKILHLRSVLISGEESFCKLFANSPVLEDVVLERLCYQYIGSGPLIISAPVLKKLDIYMGMGCDNKCEINAPALEYLRLKDDFKAGFVFTNLISLLEATIDIDIFEFDFHDDDDYDSDVYRFLQGLSNVKFLSLLGGTMKVLAAGWNFSSPKFLNLKQLKVELSKKYKHRHWPLVPKLIQYSENLEQLTCD